MYRKILMMVLFLSCLVYAANFGSTTKINILSIDKDEVATFSLLVWTADTEMQKVVFQIVSKPDNWDVQLEKNEVEISRTSGNEMIYAQDYISATSVNVFVKPYKPRPGRYSILISAKTTPVSGDLSFAQERIFNLTTVIKGQEDTIIISVPTETTTPTRTNYNFPITIFVIIFISFVIYKYS